MGRVDDGTGRVVRPRDGAVRQQIDGIGVDHQRPIGRDDASEHRGPPLAAAEPRTHRDHGGALDERFEGIRRLDSVHHHLGPRTDQRGDVLAAGRDAHQPGAGTHGGLPREPRRAGEPVIAADHEHVPEPALVGIATARADQSGAVLECDPSRGSLHVVEDASRGRRGPDTRSRPRTRGLRG